MKKFIRWAGISTALFASFLSMGMNLAYAEDTAPIITLNGGAAPVRAEIVNGKPYFSLRDFWANVAQRDTAEIKWYGDTQTVSDGWNFICLQDQTIYTSYAGRKSLTDSAVLIDGTVYVSAAFLEDTNSYSFIPYRATERFIEFHNMIWEQGEIKQYAVPIPIDVKTNLPDFEGFLEGYRYRASFDFSAEDYTITTTETPDGSIVYTYVSKADPAKSLVATARDEYVFRVEDHGAINLYQPCDE